MNNRFLKQTVVKDFLLLMAGILIYNIGTHCFIAPANIAPGGIIGIALMINYLVKIPIGILNLLLNIPLLILAWFYLSKQFVLRTGFACMVCSLSLDFVIAKVFPMYMGDMLLQSLYGGILIGVGMAFVFQSGSTTGGSDIVGYLVQKKFHHVSIGRILMLVDSAILMMSIPVFQNIDSALFGLISLYAQTKIIDAILYGSDIGSKVTIVTRQADLIAQGIIEELDRTATIIDGKGAYSKAPTNMIVCMVRKSEFSRLKKIVNNCDPDAFLMVTDSTRAFGLGFRAIHEEAGT